MSGKANDKITKTVRVLLAVLILLPATASATTYYVAKNNPSGCSDSWSGTESRPWCTIQKAADTLVAGDTVYVKEGIYREAVRPKNSGTKEKPINYLAYPGDSVIISGADEINNWHLCTSSQCPSNPYYSHIYYTEVDWNISQLFWDEEKLEQSREPDNDWWVAEGGNQTTLIDSQHLCLNCLSGFQQTDDFWKGSTLVFWDTSAHVIPERTVTSFDESEHMLTLDKEIYNDRVVEPGKDLYYLRNHLSLIDEPGEWALDNSIEPYRLYLWPPEGDPNNHLIEGSRRSRFVFEIGRHNYIHIEGFEIRYGAGHGIGDWGTNPRIRGIYLINNTVHDNMNTGIWLRETSHSLIKNNNVYRNRVGVSACDSCVIENNLIHGNYVDGLWPGNNSLVINNVIANQNIKNHPDGVQTCCSDTFNITFIRNRIINNGQCFMLEHTLDGHVINNVILGSMAYCLIFGHGTVHRWEVIGNTFGLTGYGSIRFTGVNYTVKNNIFYPAGTSPAFGAPDTNFVSDYNLFYAPPTDERGVISYNGNYYGKTREPFSEYQSLSGYDHHSVEANPLFTNYPYCMAQSGSLMASNTSSVFISDNEDCFSPGDNIEINFDGVVRKVISIGHDSSEEPHPYYLTFAPPLEKRLWHGFLVLNWKNNDNYTIDVTPLPESPACHMSETGSYVGTLPCSTKKYTTFYVDPDFSGSIKNGSASNPWNTLDSNEWLSIDNALSQSDVIVYFSAREAYSDKDEENLNEVKIYRNDNSSHRVILDGMSRYNANDQNPLWLQYTGNSRHFIKAGYPLLTGPANRSYVTIRGFKIMGGYNGYGGQALSYWGGNHVIIENNEFMHDPLVTHGPAVHYGYAHHKDSTGNGGCHDIIFRNNIIHDTYGECLYIGGSENTGLPAHRNLIIENNTIYNCGIYGGQGDCIDMKDEINNITIRYNHCFNGTGESNVNGITASSPITAYRNIVHGFPNKGITLGTYWGRGFSGIDIRNNLVFSNGEDGIYISSDTPEKPITDVYIYRNTLFNNKRNGIMLGSTGGSLDNVSIINNIIMNNNEGIGGWGTIEDQHIEFNDVIGNTIDYSGITQNQKGTNGNIEEDPMFYNINTPPGHDNIYWTNDDGFIPTAQSPVCGAGKDGNDIGAYNCMAECIHPADLDCNNKINLREIIVYISRWISGHVKMSQLISAIRMWKSG